MFRRRFPVVPALDDGSGPGGFRGRGERPRRPRVRTRGLPAGRPPARRVVRRGPPGLGGARHARPGGVRAGDRPLRGLRRRLLRGRAGRRACRLTRLLVRLLVRFPAWLRAGRPARCRRRGAGRRTARAGRLPRPGRDPLDGAGRGGVGQAAAPAERDVPAGAAGAARAPAALSRSGGRRRTGWGGSGGQTPLTSRM
ncbi:hypothetical protein SBRY_30603 [Actinacidiphila bryophytorum]|uniref:Uncharacterized protein n=1 Tax=Actinacidiphila bryophytorum TaxID=1436133 RepID=A0A9W4MBN3_9ACTN|nr:hypothetical protein SBRY_30603 [Actinacidiphila bryophytorum]